MYAMRAKYARLTTSNAAFFDTDHYLKVVQSASCQRTHCVIQFSGETVKSCIQRSFDGKIAVRQKKCICRKKIPRSGKAGGSNPLTVASAKKLSRLIAERRWLDHDGD